jgi:hypothetical protein
MERNVSAMCRLRMEARWRRIREIAICRALEIVRRFVGQGIG